MLYQVFKDDFRKPGTQELWLSQDEMHKLVIDADAFGSKKQTGRSQITLVIGELMYVLNLDITKQ